MKTSQIVDLIIDMMSKLIIKNEKGQFKYLIIKDLLPYDLACEIAKSFPNEDVLRKRDSLREYKRVLFI